VNVPACILPSIALRDFVVQLFSEDSLPPSTKCYHQQKSDSTRFPNNFQFHPNLKIALDISQVSGQVSINLQTCKPNIQPNIQPRGLDGSLSSVTQVDLDFDCWSTLRIHLVFPAVLPNLVMTNSSPWYRWPIEIDGLPIKNGDLPNNHPVNGNFRILNWRYVNVPYFRPYELWGYSLKIRPQK